jgi:hypothetical protein
MLSGRSEEGNGGIRPLRTQSLWETVIRRSGSRNSNVEPSMGSAELPLGQTSGLGFRLGSHSSPEVVAGELEPLKQGWSSHDT